MGQTLAMIGLRDVKNTINITAEIRKTNNTTRKIGVDSCGRLFFLFIRG